MIRKAFLLLLTLSAVAGLVYAQQTGGTINESEITGEAAGGMEVEAPVQALTQTGGTMTGGTMTGGAMTGGTMTGGSN